MSAHAERIRNVAKAIVAEYHAIDPHQPAWDELHDDAKADWCAVARAAINTYNSEPML